MRLELLAETGTRNVPIEYYVYLARKAVALNRTYLRTEGLCTDRRAFKYTPSPTSHYLRRCRSSISYYDTPIKARITVLLLFPTKTSVTT